MLGGTAQATAEAVDAVQHHGVRSLLDGTPRSASEIASSSGLALNDINEAIEALVQAGRIELDGDRIVGVGGLTLNTTMHALSLANAELHTWCALDAVGIPAALALKATIKSSCPQCGQPVTVNVESGTATAAGPVTLFCPTGPVDNVRTDFCSAANLFCSPNHLDEWRNKNPTATGKHLDLAATTELGHAMWGRYQPPNT